jgi:hypothetical protein
MLKWLQMSRIWADKLSSDKPRLRTIRLQGIFLIHFMAALQSFRMYTLEGAITVPTSLPHPQRTQAKCFLSDIFPVLCLTGEESCIHMLNCRQKIVCRWNCRQLHNNNFEGSKTISSHNPMTVVHKASNHHLLHDKVINCCDRLYTHWLHQLLTVGIDVYFIISPLYRICIISFFHFLRHPYIMMLASIKEI